MKIAGYDVTNITRVGAQVGCAVVTRTEAEALLKAMDSVITVPMYRIECRYLGGSWLGCSSEALSEKYSLEVAVKKVELASKEFSNNWSFRVVPV